MKKFFLTMVTLLTTLVNANAMSYEQARDQALFLTDKMAYELNLTEQQYEAAYEINLDYLMGVTTVDDVYAECWRQRNLDMSYIMLDWQYTAFCAASYFFRPVYWSSGYWCFGIYSHYPRHDFFYFSRPVCYVSYRGGHSWRHNGGISWYCSRTTHFRSTGGRTYVGMRDSHGGRTYNGGSRTYNGGSRTYNGGGRTYGGNSGRTYNGGERSSSERSGARSYDGGRRSALSGSSASGFQQRESSTRTTVERGSSQHGRTYGGSSSAPQRQYGGSSSTPQRSYGGSGVGRSQSGFGASRPSGGSFSGGGTRSGGVHSGPQGGGGHSGHGGRR